MVLELHAYSALSSLEQSSTRISIDYQPVERAFLNNFFIINTEDLIPNDYYVDIRVMNGRETRYYKKVLRFRVVSNVTNRYQ